MQSLYGAIANTNKKEIMAVSIDTVYQRVLTLANKEQRGYITPQEFNLLANQAQMEILEQYFADVTIHSKLPGSTEEYSDPLSILYEKIGIFEEEQENTWVNTNMPSSPNGYRSIPNIVYKIGTIQHATAHVEILSSKDYDEAINLPLTSPTTARPIAKITNQGILITPNTPINLISFIRRPQKVEWAYVIVNDKPLYNPNVSVNFELHPSEETELVYKILKLAGFNLKAVDVAQAAAALEQENKQTTL